MADVVVHKLGVRGVDNGDGTVSLVVASARAAPKTGQKKIAVTNTAIVLGSGALVNGVVVKAKSTNTGPVFVGPTGVTTLDDGTGNGYALAPGAAAGGATRPRRANCDRIRHPGSDPICVDYSLLLLSQKN